MEVLEVQQLLDLLLLAYNHPNEIFFKQELRVLGSMAPMEELEVELLLG
jgi:hypothetical protein